MCADCVSEHCEIDNDHGRIEARRWGLEPNWWPGHSVVMGEASRELGEMASLGAPLVRHQSGARCRAHCERGVRPLAHQPLCIGGLTGGGEEPCRLPVQNAAQNCAILRRIVLNTLERERSTQAGMKAVV